MTAGPPSRDDLRHALRSRNLAALAGSWVHDLKGHLNTAVLAIQVIRRSLPPSDDRERPRAQLQQIADEITQVDRVMQSILQPLREPAEPLQPVDLREVAEEARRFAHAWRGSATGVTIEPATGRARVLVQGRPREIALCATNLAANALAAMGDGGALRLVIDQTEREGSLLVADSGPGIPAAVLAELDRAATGSFEATDIGLGLRAVRLLVRGVGATLRAWTPPEGGGMVALRFPLAHPDR